MAIFGAIPMPQNSGDIFSGHVNNMIKQLMDRQHQEQQNKQYQSTLAQQQLQHQDAMGLQRAAAGRAAQAAADAHRLVLQKLDPDYEINQFKHMMSAFGGNQQMPSQETPLPSYMPGINPESGMNQGQIPALAQGAVSPMDVQQQANQPSGGLDVEAIKNNPMLRGWFKHKFGIDLGAESPYQGAARNASDLERLRKEVGDSSPVYQNAKAEYDANIQNKNDLGALRERTISGLKAGERWIKDEESGERVGIEHNLSEKERDREIGRGFFNELYPVVYRGAAPFSGEGSIRKLEQAASQYNTDPVARKMFDDFLLSEKALTATTVNEAATLGAGKTNQTYKQLRESLGTSDVPEKIKSLIKQYQIPASANLRASMRFQELINNAQEKATKNTPATRKLYFNPEDQSQNEMVLIEDQDGNQERVTKAEAKKRGAIK